MYGVILKHYKDILSPWSVVLHYSLSILYRFQTQVEVIYRKKTLVTTELTFRLKTKVAFFKLRLNAYISGCYKWFDSFVYICFTFYRSPQSIPMNTASCLWEYEEQKQTDRENNRLVDIWTTKADVSAYFTCHSLWSYLRPWVHYDTTCVEVSWTVCNSVVVDTNGREMCGGQTHFGTQRQWLAIHVVVHF